MIIPLKQSLICVTCLVSIIIDVYTNITLLLAQVFRQSLISVGEDMPSHAPPECPVTSQGVHCMIGSSTLLLARVATLYEMYILPNDNCRSEIIHFLSSKYHCSLLTLCMVNSPQSLARPMLELDNECHHLLI